MPYFPLPNFPKRTSGYAALLAAAVLPLTLAACTDNNAAAAAGPIKVSSTADACTLSSQGTKSGNITFAIQNDGTQVTEFYLLAEDGAQPSTRPTSRTRPSNSSPAPRSSPRPTPPATPPRPVTSTPQPACTGSASNP